MPMPAPEQQSRRHAKRHHHPRRTRHRLPRRRRYHRSLAQGRRLRFQSIHSQSRADHLIDQQRRTGSRQCHGRKRTLGKTHQRIGRTGCQIRQELQERTVPSRCCTATERAHHQTSAIHPAWATQPRHAHRHQRRHGTDGTGTSRLRNHRLPEGNRCEARRPAARSERPDRQQVTGISQYRKESHALFHFGHAFRPSTGHRAARVPEQWQATY